MEKYKDNETGRVNILCVDMDAFFASVEQATNPSLKGKPMAVIGAQERSVIVTSSYEARKKGVKTGMNKYTALKVCPELILVEASGRKYTAVSSQIAEILTSITPESAMYSVDEAFLDIKGTGLSAKTASFMIKSIIKEKLGITCTIGAGPNRLIAKMATHINKPDGYYEVNPWEILPFIDSFKLSEIWGIGRKSVKKFNAMGIFTPKDLRNFGEEKLLNMFGIPGQILFKLVSGQSEAAVPRVEPNMKSVGHSITLPRDISSKDKIFAYILQLSHMVSARARKYGYFGKTVTLIVRFPDMSTISHSRSYQFHTSSTRHINHMARDLFEEIIKPGVHVRLLGVSLSGISKEGAKCSTVEDATEDKNSKWMDVYSAVDSINMKFGDKAVGYASAMVCESKGLTVIPPTWQPEGARNINIEDN